MICGIGIDLVETARIAAAVQRFGERFAARILTERELVEYRASARPVALLARRFAAKEALVKALGTGLRDGVTLRDMSVTHDGAGRPGFDCRGRVDDLLQARAVIRLHLSLSDERSHAVACVVLERAAR